MLNLMLPGFAGFNVRSGHIERISLAIPWSRLYSGGFRARSEKRNSINSGLPTMF